MRDQAARDNDIDRMQAWARQTAGLARAEPAADIAADLWHDAEALLG
jgi:nitronate monooxygenase